MFLVVLLLVNLFGVWPQAQGPAPLGLEKRKGKNRLPLYDFHRFFRLSWDRYWESGTDDLATVSILLLDHRPNARGPLEVLVGIVLGELDSSTPRVPRVDSID